MQDGYACWTRQLHTLHGMCPWAWTWLFIYYELTLYYHPRLGQLQYGSIPRILFIPISVQWICLSILVSFFYFNHFNFYISQFTYHILKLFGYSPSFQLFIYQNLPYKQETWWPYCFVCVLERQGDHKQPQHSAKHVLISTFINYIPLHFHVIASSKMLHYKS